MKIFHPVNITLTMVTPLQYDEEPKRERHENADWIYGDFEKKPDTERELYFLQLKYLETRDQDTWKAMFKIIYEYARSLVLKRLKNRTYIEPDEVADYAGGAAQAFMRQYLTKPHWSVGASFAGMLKWKVVEVMYRYKSEDDHVSLNSIGGKDDDKGELLDSLGRVGFSTMSGSYNPRPEDCLDKWTVSDVVDEVLGELDTVCNDEMVRLLTVLKMVLVLRKPRNRHVKTNFINRWERDFKSFSTLERVELELKKRMSEKIE
jgi:hypothetical protein